MEIWNTLISENTTSIYMKMTGKKSFTASFTAIKKEFLA